MGACHEMGGRLGRELGREAGGAGREGWAGEAVPG